MSVDRVKKLLQLLGCQDSIREVCFEFIEGQFAIVCKQKNENMLVIKVIAKFILKDIIDIMLNVTVIFS